MHTQHLSQLKAVVYGAAMGDALGVPFEFLHRGTFACEGMSAGGFHNMPLGTFSDDTSLLIATCDSIRATKGIDIHDMRAKFRQWCFEGRYSADGKVFDVGNATVTALDQSFGCSHERSNGNGSLMRIAPLASRMQATTRSAAFPQSPTRTPSRPNPALCSCTSCATYSTAYPCRMPSRRACPKTRISPSLAPSNSWNATA